MQTKFEKHILLKQQEQTVLDCLKENTDLSKRQLKSAMQNGAVWLETAHGINRVRRVKKIAKQGEIIHFYYNAQIQNNPSPVPELIADEGDYSIWNKPTGMYSQGSKWGDHFTIYRWAEQNLVPQRPAFIVHRLDRSANGLMILAHKKSVAAKFSKMFEHHEIYKQYKARVEGVITGITLPFEISDPIDGKPAISEIVALSTDSKSNTSEVEIVIKTGRKHQIRRHMSCMGFPIVGDRLYEAKNLEENLQLSSVCLMFVCPVTSKLKKYELNKN